MGNLPNIRHLQIKIYQKFTGIPSISSLITTNTGGIHMLTDFLQFDFLRHTFLTGLLIGVIAPLLGTFLVVRRLSLLADALSHVTLAGVAFGLFIEKKTATPLIRSEERRVGKE